MSVIHNILTKKPLDLSRLNDFVSSIDKTVIEDRGEGTYYFWTEGRSTRGFDITIDRDVIEIRNTILSNRCDYELTNQVVEKILNLTDGLILDEGEEQVSNLPVFDDNRISEAEIHDCETIQLLSKEHEDIAIYGPIRKVHFGKRLHESFKNLKGEKLRDKMFDIILSVNYQIPDFEYGNIMQVGNNEDDKKIMKLLTNKTDYIIDKYDYILLNTSDEKPIMITNEILNKMLPSNWTLVDEFTVVAPITSESEWEKLLSTAKQYDQFGTFKS